MRKYDPQLCVDAENLYNQGQFDKALSLALEVHELARREAFERWDSTKRNSSPLAKQTKVWDSTNQKYVNHTEFIRMHNWKDDIAPAPLRIACKCLRSLAKLALKTGDKLLAEKYHQEIKELEQAAK